MESTASACAPANIAPVVAITFSSRLIVAPQQISNYSSMSYTAMTTREQPRQCVRALERHGLSFANSLGVSLVVTRHDLRPAHKKDDESDDEYRSEADIHKNLRWCIRHFIAAQATQPVGTLPHLMALNIDMASGDL
jgi:hypothetical protein